MGQEAGYIRYEDSKGVETARAMAEVSEGGGLLVKDHIATVQVVAGMLVLLHIATVQVC